MTFQQEERRREELRKQEEEKRRQQLEEQQRMLQEEEMRRRQEEEMKRRQEEEMKRRQEEEMKRRQEEEMKRRREEEMKRRQEEEMRRKKEEEMKRRQEEEVRRRQEEEKRIEFERQQMLRLQEEERKRQEVLRFEQLKKEEEQKRAEEMRLEQEMRRQFELQQRKEKQQRLEQEQREAEAARQASQSSAVRDHIPKIPKNKSFEASQDRPGEVRHEDHLGTVKTGQVQEKRNFWMRSTSMDRLTPSQGLSPAPRRRRIDWNSRQRDGEDGESRPGSSLGQANTGSVRNISSGFLAKSKSSAAVMQDEMVERGRPKQRNLISNGWTKEKYDQEVKQEFFKSQELKTNKVHETIQTFGKKETGAGSVSGRSTPAPSRNIGEVFAENKIGKAHTEKSSAQANSWRTKTPEPTVKLVNVSVEKAAGSNQNIHISENAQRQMASYITSHTAVEQSSHTTNTMSSQSSVTSHCLSSGSSQAAAQPPPAPERNQSYGGKTCTVASDLPELETANCEQSVESVSRPCPANTSLASLQTSMSTQSINSLLSTCSSSKIPLPVKNAWFDELENSTATSTVSNNQPPSPTKTNPTPLPVVANWFENLESKLTKSKQVKKEIQTTNIDVVTTDLDELFDELIVDSPEGKEHPPVSPAKIFMTDDADNCSIRSEAATVIETQVQPQPQPQPQSEPASVLVVPQSPSEIRKKFQQGSSFEKGFTKSSELEFSREFKEGIRGKVKESRDNFLRQVTGQTRPAERLQPATEELQQIKLQRAASQTEERESKAIDVKQQEKLQELEAVKRSRSKSRHRDERSGEEDVVQNSYTLEKRERELELQQLTGRNTNMSWQPENREETLREERSRELAEITARAQERTESPRANLQPLENLSELELSQMIWNERAEELKMMSQMRPRSPEVRGKVRSTAAAWKEREKSSSRDGERESHSPSLPTRRIGSLFNRDPDYWNLNDTTDLPEPPREVSTRSPPTPRRQSSKGKMEEYAREQTNYAREQTNWNNNWRKC